MIVLIKVFLKMWTRKKRRIIDQCCRKLDSQDFSRASNKRCLITCARACFASRKPNWINKVSIEKNNIRSHCLCFSFVFCLCLVKLLFNYWKVGTVDCVQSRMSTSSESHKQKIHQICATYRFWLNMLLLISYVQSGWTCKISEHFGSFRPSFNKYGVKSFLEG